MIPKLNSVVRILFGTATVIVLQSCTQTVVEDVSVPLLIVKKNELNVLLDSLINRERECGYEDEGLRWVVSFKKASKQGINMIVTKMRGFPKVYGCFYVKKTLIVVDGEFVDSLFSISAELEMFRLKIKRDVPAPETFSTWVYYLRDDEFILENAWPFPCRK